MIDIMPPHSDTDLTNPPPQIFHRHPLHKSHHLQRHTSHNQTRANNAQATQHHELLQRAAMELESMRQFQPQNHPTAKTDTVDLNRSILASSTGSHNDDGSRPFPPACLRLLLLSLPKNSRCMDCNSTSDVTWASVTYGVTLCLKCSGNHRGLGVRCSFVKSLTMDSWNQVQVLAMLEGGNEQLAQFYARHKMGANDSRISSIDRYKTKAASFYKQHLAKHTREVVDNGIYLGREASRRRSRRKANCEEKRSEQIAPQKVSSVNEALKTEQLPIKKS